VFFISEGDPFEVTVKGFQQKAKFFHQKHFSGINTKTSFCIDPSAVSMELFQLSMGLFQLCSVKRIFFNTIKILSVRMSFFALEKNLCQSNWDRLLMSEEILFKENVNFFLMKMQLFQAKILFLFKRYPLK